MRVPIGHGCCINRRRSSIAYIRSTNTLILGSDVAKNCSSSRARSPTPPCLISYTNVSYHASCRLVTLHAHRVNVESPGHMHTCTPSCRVRRLFQTAIICLQHHLELHHGYPSRLGAFVHIIRIPFPLTCRNYRYFNKRRRSRNQNKNPRRKQKSISE